MPAVFPESVCDTPATLRAQLGSWWAEDYAAKEQLAAVVDGLAAALQHTAADSAAMLRSYNRQALPVLRTQPWYQLKLLRSELVEDARGYTFRCPAQLQQAPLLSNRINTPTVTMLAAADFTLGQGTVTFRRDPFEDPRIARRNVYTDGALTDTELLLWCFRPGFDHQDIFVRYGYVLSLLRGTGSDYKKLVNAGWDNLVSGNTNLALRQAVAAIAGRPLAEAPETVVATLADSDWLRVATDQQVYRFPATDCPVVSVGQQLSQGESLTGGLQFAELNRGGLPSWLRGLSLGRGWLSPCFYGELQFADVDTPLIVDTNHYTGFTRLSWSLGGLPGDVDRFFEELHERGVAAATPVEPACAETRVVSYPASDCDEEDITLRAGTLAHWLDTRADRVGEPTASHLPKTINPLRFLVENVLRGSVLLARIQAPLSPSNLLRHASLLRLLTPAHTTVMLCIELPAATDTIAAESVAESSEVLYGAETVTDTIYRTSVEETGHNLARASAVC